MTWFVLAVICAFSLATADVLVKRSLPGEPGGHLLVARFCTTAVLLAPLVAFQPWPDVPPVFWGWLSVLVPLELAAMLLYVLAIRDYPLHLTLPYLAFTPVFNVLTANVILDESVSPAGLAGILLVVVGTYLLNLGPMSDRRSWLAPLGAVFRERGSRLMLGAAAIYSLTSPGSKAAMGHTTPEIFGPFYYVVIGAALCLALSMSRPEAFAVLLRRPWTCLAVGLLMSVMIVTHFLAISRVEVAYFISVKRTSLLFGIVYGALLFGERHLARHLFAGALMVAGVALIVDR